MKYLSIALSFIYTPSWIPFELSKWDDYKIILVRYWMLIDSNMATKYNALSNVCMRACVRACGRPQEMMFKLLLLWQNNSMSLDRDVLLNVKKYIFWYVRPMKSLSACVSVRSDQSLRCPYEKTLHPSLTNLRLVKIHNRLCECTGWSESLLGRSICQVWWL